MQSLTAIGLMSGTSMDGVDAACVQTDGRTLIQVLDRHYIPYPATLRQQLILIVKSAHQAHGDLEQTAQLVQSTGENFQTILEELTDYHCHATRALLDKLPTSPIDLIGLHGQTIFHHPATQQSLQVCLPHRLANTFKIPIIHNFRANDLAHGGQGAPIAPIYHLARCYQEGIPSAVVINCGGISNITVIHNHDPEQLLSFDTGPGNTLLDRYIFSRSGGTLYLDQDGIFSLPGECHARSFELLIQAHEAYLHKPPPKSLDIADLQWVHTLNDLSLEDACRTLATFTSYTIAEGIQRFADPIPNLWILAGGGAYHPVIVSSLKQYAEACGAKLALAHDIGWNNNSLEAELMAFAAVRMHYHLPLTYPNTTGVSSPQIGGICCSAKSLSPEELGQPDHTPIPAISLTMK